MANLKPLDQTYKLEHILLNKNIYKHAAETDQLDLLQWFYQNGLLLTDLSYLIGAPGTYARIIASNKGEQGNIAFLVWLNSIPAYKSLLPLALKHFQQQGVFVTEEIADVAALGEQV